MAQKGYIVFDCDGTLIASHGAILEALRVLMSEHLNRSVTLREAASVYDPDMLKCARNLGVDVADQALLARLSKRWIELCQSVGAEGHILYEGVLDLVKTLAQRGHEIYVWTARDRQSTGQILKGFGLAPYVLDMRCMDDTTPKPHPQGLIEMLGEVARSDVLVIGDSSTDVMGARQFGAQAIGALWGEHMGARERESLRAAGAHYFAQTPSECLEIIEKYLSGESDV